MCEQADRQTCKMFNMACSDGHVTWFLWSGKSGKVGEFKLLGKVREHGEGQEKLETLEF